MWHACSRFQLTTDCNRMVSNLLLQAISSYWAWAGKEKARAEVSSIASRVRLSECLSSPACRSRCNNWATPLLPLPPWNNISHANRQFLAVDPTTSKKNQQFLTSNMHIHSFWLPNMYITISHLQHAHNSFWPPACASTSKRTKGWKERY